MDRERKGQQKPSPEHLGVVSGVLVMTAGRNMVAMVERVG
jgi:hypothetical protein